MQLLATTFALLAFPPGPASVTPVPYWPQWRGPHGDSVVGSPNDPTVSTTHLPTKWSKTENVAWRVLLPGWGTSTPAIFGDAIFVTSQEDDKLFVLRLDRATGKTAWQREAGTGTPRRKGPVGPGRFHDEHNMATPSPVVDGEHLWVHFGNGDLLCYDHAGNKKWAVNLTDNHGIYTIWWGHGNSPVLVGDVIVSACMQDPKGGGKSYVVAHDKRTGKQVWSTDRTTGSKDEWADSYTTPLVRMVDGKAEVIVFGGNQLDGYDPATGVRRWHAKPYNGNRVISGPTLVGDVVYAVQGMRGPLFAVKAGGAGDVTEANTLWKYAGTTPDSASPVLANGLVFLATNAGVGVCVDAKTGAEVWKERLSSGFRATPLVFRDQVYFFGKDGKTSIVKASRTFEVVAEANLGEDITASPAVAERNLYLRTKEALYRIGEK